MPRLILTLGGRTVMEHRLRDGRTVIGRSDACDFTIPGETISRTHCVVQSGQEGWQLIDRSRHGVQVNGSTIEGSHDLEAGDRIALDEYVLEFARGGKRAGPTASVGMAKQPAEELVAAEGALAVLYARLEVVEGPASGQVVLLEHTKQTVGGPGSDEVLDD